MSRLLKPDIVDGVKDLIRHITGSKENSQEFNNHEQRIYDLIKKSTNYLYFPNLKDLNDDIDNVIKKFHYHSFHRHGNYLKKLYDTYLKQFHKNDITNHLTIIKFLLLISQNPTEQFWQNPEKFEFLYKQQLADDENSIDWYGYLMEGIDIKPTNSDESSELSDIGGDADDEEDDNHSVKFNKTINQRKFVIKEVENLQICNFTQSRQELLETVQHSWFNLEKFSFKPPSNHPEATIALRWDEFLQKQSHGLVNIEPDNIITEYKVIREILWQLWGGHSSTIFQFSGNKIRIKSNITISSVRQICFESFLQLFLEYIEILDEFREFTVSLTITPTSYTIPETYKCYTNGINNIFKLFMRDLLKIEDEIRQQETTFTLLNLVDFLKNHFEPIRILQIVHNELELDDFKQTLPIICVLKLLINLHQNLNSCYNKLEQNIKLSLYLESIFYYLKTIDDWLIKDDLNDATHEFIVVNKNSYDSQKNHPNWHMNFELQSEIDDLCDSDGFLKIICNDVLQIGRNLHFLRILGQYNTFNDSQETIYQEFLRRIFQELHDYYEIIPNAGKDIDLKSNHDSQYESLDNLNDYVDTSDGFLMRAFDEFLCKNDENFEIHHHADDDDDTIFSKLNQLPNHLFPIQQTIELVMKQILNERFITSGLMVKNFLIDKYNLEKLFQFLRHLYLFGDDLIFPFYRRLFEKMATSQQFWGNEIWLTSHLQDIIMDVYPNFYMEVLIKIDQKWQQYPHQTYEICNLINIEYHIDWPLNIIITDDHMMLYKEIFNFLLTLKWALFTLNRLSYTDLTPRKIKNTNVIIKRLMCLRYYLINLLSNIQHYIFGFVFNQWHNHFEADFEKANNLQSIMAAHSYYINSIYGDIIRMRDCKNGDYGYESMLVAVNLLKVIWTKTTNLEKINNCYKLYRNSYKVIYPLINPTYIFSC